IIFAASHDLAKRFLLSATAVEVNVHARNRTLPCHPPAEDPLLAWLEEFMVRVQCGAYQPNVLRTPESLSAGRSEDNLWSSQRVLSLCPSTQAYGCGIAVTQVRMYWTIHMSSSAAFTEC